MRTALYASPNSLDEHERSFVEKVREHGWFRTGVFADETGPGFSYTTGLWLSANRPELIMFGMKADIAQDVFWGLFREAQGGDQLSVGQRTDAVFANAPAYAFSVAKKHYASFLGWSRWFYAGDKFPCLQIVWPDPAGVFPWEPGFDVEFQADQPDLTDRGWLNEIVD